MSGELAKVFERHFGLTFTELADAGAAFLLFESAMQQTPRSIAGWRLASTGNDVRIEVLMNDERIVTFDGDDVLAVLKRATLFLTELGI